MKGILAPYTDMVQSVKCFDRRTLVQQTHLMLQAYNAFVDRNAGKFDNRMEEYSKIPGTMQWHGYTDALKLYYNIARIEMASRGIPVASLPRIDHNLTVPIDMPKWWGDPAIHRSHRSALLKYSPMFYGKYNWKEKEGLPALFPSNPSYTRVHRVDLSKLFGVDLT